MTAMRQMPHERQGGRLAETLILRRRPSQGSRPRPGAAVHGACPVSQLPEPGPQTAAQEPEPRCPASTGVAHNDGARSRRRTADKRSKGPTTVSGDQAPDLYLPGSGGGI